MIGIILAAGQGTRLRDYIDMDNIGTKCLLKIDNKTLIERMIFDFKKIGVIKIIVVCGFKRQLLVNFVKELEYKYCIEIETINNPIYDKSNTGYSLFLALKELDMADDIIVINGDVLYEFSIINSLHQLPNTCMVIDADKKLTDESFKLKLKNNKIEKMGKTIQISDSTGEFIGLSKISEKHVFETREILENIINRKFTEYYDLMFQELSNRYIINFYFIQNQKWTEIDTIEDFNYAVSISTQIDEDRFHEE